MPFALLLLCAAPQDSPAAELLREARRLKGVAESRETANRGIPELLAAIDEALAKYRQARASPDADDGLVEKAMNDEEDLLWRAGDTLGSVGRFDEARVRFEASIETCRGTKTERHSRIARTHASLAGLELDRGRLEEAQAEVAEAEAELLVGTGERQFERRVQAVKAVGPFLIGEKGPYLQSLLVLQLDHGLVQGILQSIGDNALNGPQRRIFFRPLRRPNSGPEQRPQRQHKHHTMPNHPNHATLPC